MPKIYLLDKEHEQARLARRMDKFDAVVTEYLRRTNYTVSDLAFQVQINPSTLWRWRKRVDAFMSAPFGTVTKILRISGCPADILRYICGYDK